MGTHSTDAERDSDAARSAYLAAQGYKIFRAYNQKVYDNLDGVLDTLLAFVEGKIE
jgi:very-short-patch-repair endonuclease